MVEGEMQYFDNSEDTLDYLIVHLWMNPFNYKQPHWAIQQIQMGSRDFHFLTQEERGSYTYLQVRAGWSSLGVEDYIQAFIRIGASCFFNSYEALMVGPSMYSNPFPQPDLCYVFSPSFAVGSSELVGFAAVE